MTILVTGAAGFIGAALSARLLAQGRRVIGIDNFNTYYDVSLKEARFSRLEACDGFTGLRMDIADREGLMRLFAEQRPTICVNLAAQAGVRHSLKEPFAYTHSNIDGFLSLLEAARAYPLEHLLFASSSSVYGANAAMPFSVHQGADHPLSLYAATKKANEMMAHTYAHLFGIPCTGLRFFTVYGPWGRPDMALFKFTRAILEGLPIEVYNHGRMQRDFTYIDDIVGGMEALLDLPPQAAPDWNPEAPDPATSGVAPYRLLNIGNSRSEELMRYIEVLEDKIGQKAEKRMLPMQDGDVAATWADVSDLTSLTHYRPDTPIETGVGRFVDWYRDYYRV